MTMVHAVSKRSVQFVLYFLCFILNWSGTEVAAQDALRMRLSGSGELGKDATLTCVMNHKGNVTWAFAGAPIKIENRYSVTTNLTEIEGTLENSFVVTIRNTTKRDVGVYSCMFEKEKVDTTLHLYFNGSLLKITDGPVERDLQNHPIEKVILFCIFEVYNTTAASWYKKESNDKKSGTDVVIDERSFKSSYFVSITNSDIDDGTYVCEVYDPVAEHYITGEVDVHIRDRPWITLFEVIPISDTELYLNWTVNIHHCPIQKYEVTYKVSNELVIRYNNQEIPINSTRFVLNNLNKTTTYDVTLYVNTTCGTTPMLKSNTTLNKKPVFVPDISIKGFSATSVTIGWVSPPANIAHLIHYYLLEARKNNDNDNITKLAYHSKDSKNLPYMFDNLEPYSTYTFRVQACSYYLESCWEWSKTTDAATLDGIPGHPENLDVECGDKYVTAKWAEPLKPNAEIRGYQLEITGVANYKDHLGNNKTDTWGPRSKFEKSDSKSARFDGLFPNMKYTVRVSAFSRTRKRGVEAVRACATPPAPPDALPRPHWQKIMLENGTFLFKAYLQKVTERNGPICCYRVYMMRLPADMNWIGLPELDKIRVVTYEQAHTGPPILAAYITDVFTNDKFPEGSHIILGDNQPTKRMPDEDNCIRCSKVPQRDVPTTTSTTSTSTTTTTTTTTTSITLAPVEDTKSRRRRNASEPDDEVQPQDGMLDPAYNYTFFIELIPGEPWLEPVYTSSNSVLMAAPSDPPSRPLTALEIALQATCACAALALVVALVVCAVHARRDAKPPHAHELNRIHNVLRRFNLGGRPMVPTTPPDLPPIAKEDLAAAYAERQADSDYGFQKEFEMLPDCFVDRTTHASEARENQSKNRYPDIKAYDQTRVRLSQIDSITGSDYINANYVMGYQERKQFICAQGPTETTVNDFWRMIWEHGLELIVMLTNLEEYSKVKCSKYWPDEVRGSRAFGNVTVHHVSEKRYSDYIVRELKISKQSSTACIDGEPIYANNGVVANGECKLAEDKDEGRTVHQYHFLMWKDFAAPEYPHSILKFIKRVNEAWSGVMARPAVVHCSAGVGRTGTLVALDYLLDQLRDTGHVSIFNTIAELRRQRNFLVQSLKQYVFVYRALVEYAHYGDTEIPASRLKTSIDRLRNTPEDEDKCLMEHEFEKICNSPVEPATRSCAAGAAEELRPRNRRADCLPYDANRVILTPLPGRDYSTYINASFIEAYDNSEGFIITQDPLPNTIMDFWRMVSEHNVSTIVMLSELGEGKCPRYWEDGTATHEHISVQYEESDSCPYYTRRQFRVTNNKNGDVSVVRQLQYQGWPTAPGHVPEVTRGLAELADAALPAAGAGTHVQATRPLAVHCQGTERSALFVALCVLITQLRVERRVDVCAAARKVRDQRARTIDSVTQYEFLHRAILNYAELHNLQEDS